MGLKKKETIKKETVKTSVPKPKKMDVERASTPKVIEKKGVSSSRIQTAEGWKRMMKKLHQPTDTKKAK